MIEIEHKEKEKVDNLYNEVKRIILSKRGNKTFDYSHKQHHLYEESEYPGISKNYYNESGSVEFENINGQIIRLEIYRWHPHKHNGWSGLNGNPCLTAVIYIVENEEKKILWELNVKSGTLYYKAEVSSLDIPYDILQERKLPQKSDIQEYEVEGLTEPCKEEKRQPPEQQETIILFDEIKKISNKHRTAKQMQEDIIFRRKKEIEEATKKIFTSYSQKLVQNNEDITATKRELNALDKLLAKYSTFNIDLIGMAIQQLMSIVESEEYLYKQVTYKFNKRVHGVMDSWDEEEERRAIIVVKKDKLTTYYENSCTNENGINELVRNGNGVLLSEQDINSRNNKKITFYTSQDGQIICHVDYGRFDYIKEFIDSIIQYRFQNEIVELTERTLLSFMQNFILSHRGTIIENYESIIKEKALSLTLSTS